MSAVASVEILRAMGIEMYKKGRAEWRKAVVGFKLEK